MAAQEEVVEEEEEDGEEAAPVAAQEEERGPPPYIIFRATRALRDLPPTKNQTNPPSFPPRSPLLLARQRPRAPRLPATPEHQ